MSDEKYREIAVKFAAMHSIRPVKFTLECKGGCHATVSTTVKDVDIWRGNGELRAQWRLAERAAKLGWDTDNRGDMVCKACATRLGL